MGAGLLSPDDMEVVSEIVGIGPLGPFLSFLKLLSDDFHFDGAGRSDHAGQAIFAGL